MVREHHVPLSHLVVQAEVSLVEAVLADQHSQSVFQVVIDSSEVEGFLAPDHLVVFLTG